MENPSFKRASALSKRLAPERRQLDTPPRESLLENCRQTPAERSIIWFVTTLCAIAVSIMLVIAIWLGHQRVSETTLVTTMDDARWGEDYRSHRATDWAFIDDKNLVITTQGGGVQHCRLDGELAGIWETFDSRRTGGLLAEDNLRQVHNDGQRLWFVGDRGSLSSCNLKFGDWKLHFGAGGFVPNLDLSSEITTLAASPDQTIFALGTRNSGLGVYDVVLRQWHGFSANEKQLHASSVTCLLMRNNLLWVGTSQGLNVFSIERAPAGLIVKPLPDRELPLGYTNKSVLALSWVETSNGGSVECVVGRYAHLQADAQTGSWRVLVAESDVQLDTLSGAGVVDSVVSDSRGIWMGVPKYGMAFYNPAYRQLTLHNEGLPGSSLFAQSVTLLNRQADGAEPELWGVLRSANGMPGQLYRRRTSLRFTTSDIKDVNSLAIRLRDDKLPLYHYLNSKLRAKTLALVSDSTKSEELKQALVEDLNTLLEGSSIYDPQLFANVLITEEMRQLIMQQPAGEGLVRLNRLLLDHAFTDVLAASGRWEQVGSDHVSQLQLMDQQPLLRLEDGTVKLLELKDGNITSSLTLFQESNLGLPFGPSAVAANQFFVASGADGQLPIAARYIPSIRSWQPLEADTNTRFKQFRATDNSVWGVKLNGEAGYFAPLNTWNAPRYVSVMGPSSLTAESGHVITAEIFKGRFWFARETVSSSTLVYVYDPKTHSITTVKNGLPNEFTPLQLRATSEAIYLRGTLKNRWVIYSCSDNNLWKQVGPENQNATQLVTDASSMYSLDSSGRLDVYTDHDPARRSLAFGNGSQQWRRIIPDRFGRLSCLNADGRVVIYTRQSASWQTLTDSATDILLINEDETNDRLLVGTSQGMHSWIFSADSVKQDDKTKADSPFQRESVQQFALNGSDVWALTKEGETRSIWRRELSDKDWTLIWKTDTGHTTPQPYHWYSPVFANFVKDEFWLVTRDGYFWQYGLRSPRWKQKQLQGPMRNVQVSDANVLWWLDETGTLRAIDPGNEKTLTFDGVPDHRSVWGKVSVGLEVLSVIAAALFLLFAVVLTLITGLYWCLYKAVCLLLRKQRAGPKIIKPNWKVVGLLLLACVFCRIFDEFVAIPLVDAYSPFEDQHFVRQVLDYAMGDGVLIIHTNKGTWRFKIKGLNVTPHSFSPGVLLPLSPKVVTYPLSDPSGNWQVRKGDLGMTLWRRNQDGTYLPCHSDKNGFTEDAIDNIAINDGDTLIATTPAGLAEYKIDEQLKLSRFTPLSLSKGTLVHADQDLYYWARDGTTYRYTNDAAGVWTQATSPWPRTIQANAVHWKTTPLSDEFLETDLDLASGIFNSDKISALAQDTGGHVWIQTKAGWRSYENTEHGAGLTEPLAAPSSELTSQKGLAATSSWDCLRISSTSGTDTTAFIFRNSPDKTPLNDPFGTNARWPDENVTTILPEGETIWMGTAYGLRRSSQNGFDALSLPGRRIFSISRRGNSLSCSTDDGDYILNGDAWQRTTIPTGEFTEPSLQLPFGDGLTLRARQQLNGTSTTTELQDFDPQRGRFTFDAVTAIEAEAGGFSFLSAAGGVQRIWLKDKQVTNQRHDLSGANIVSLRHGADQALYAYSEGQEVWRSGDDARWQRLADNSDNPFRTPVSETLAGPLKYERRYARDGDTFRLKLDQAPIDFKEGKLTSDYVTGATGFNSLRWESTPAGIVQTAIKAASVETQTVIPWQSGNAISEVAVDGEQLVSGSAARSYRYDLNQRTWSPISTSAFNKPEVSFDGLRWQLASIPADRPHLSLRICQGMPASDCNPVGLECNSVAGGSLLKLNSFGQFPFDSIQSALGHSSDLWLSHGSGVTVYNAATFLAQFPKALRYVQTQNCLIATTMLAADKQGRVWLSANSSSGGVVGLYVHDGSSRFLPAGQAERILNPFAGLQWTGSSLISFPEPIVGLRNTQSRIWVLTSRGLASVRPEDLKRLNVH